MNDGKKKLRALLYDGEVARGASEEEAARTADALVANADDPQPAIVEGDERMRVLREGLARCFRSQGASEEDGERGADELVADAVIRERSIPDA